MIRYAKGDVLTTNDDIILHGCNSAGVMGAGVALAIKRKFPKAEIDYVNGLVKDLEAGNDVLGKYYPSFQPDGKIILNAITQTAFGRNGKFVSYDAVDLIMERLSKEKIKSHLDGENL